MKRKCNIAPAVKNVKFTPTEFAFKNAAIPVKKKPKSKIRQALHEPTDLNKLKSKSKKRRHSKMNRLSSSLSHQIEC